MFSKELVFLSVWPGQDLRPGKFERFWKFHPSFLLCLKLGVMRTEEIVSKHQCLAEPLNDLLRKMKILITIAVDWDSSKKHKIQWLVLMLFNKERLQQVWKKKRHAKKPTTNKNSQMYSYSFTGDNCITFDRRFSNGPWGLDSHPCPIFTVLPRSCCWQVRYAVEQGSVNYSPQANSGSRTSFVTVFPGTQSCPFVSVLSITAFAAQWHSGRVATETVRPTEPKTLIIWPFIEKVNQFPV